MAGGICRPVHGHKLALRERAVASELYAAEDLPEFPLDSELLALLGLIGGGFDFSVEGEE